MPLPTRNTCAADLRAAFDRALADDRLELHYQPVLNPASGEAIFVEALIRCPDGRDAYAANSELIPAIGGGARLRALSEWVLCQALAQAEKWQAAGLPARISVNLPLEQAADGDFLSWLIDEGAHAANNLLLEIAEGQVISSGSPVEAGLRRLGRAGFSLVLDNFGAGFSDLARLRDWHVHMLKADRGLAARLYSESGRCFVEAMISVCNALGFDVVMVGVESAEVATTLDAMGAPAVQGFHFARPMAPAACAMWLGRSPREFPSQCAGGVMAAR